MIFPLISRIYADWEPTPTPESGFTEGRRGSGAMTSAANRDSDSEFLTEGNQENEVRNVRRELIFVTFVSFCKNPKELDR